MGPEGLRKPTRDEVADAEKGLLNWGLEAKRGDADAQIGLHEWQHQVRENEASAEKELYHWDKEIQEKEKGYDFLTGARNLEFFTHALEKSLIKMREHHRKGEGASAEVSLIALDIDHFKSINDAFGHGAGDTVLQRIVALMQSSVREDDIVARLSGEEFAVLLPGSNGHGPTKAEELRKKISELVFDEYPSLEVRASFGVLSLDPSFSVVVARKRVDDALYVAKNTGRNRVIIA
ncbi:MAG: pleD1 [Parcubacteria group bacterium]|nr:pleD1 [Parcubacteria group bacterium]